MSRVLLLGLILLTGPSAGAQTYMPPPRPYPRDPLASSALKMTMANSAFRQGIVGRVWVGLVLHLTPTNGGASEASVYIVRPGGNGTPVINGGTIRAAGDGDRMDAFFVDGKLYVTNEIYLPGEAHCCGSQAVVQVFAVNADANELVLLVTKAVPVNATRKQILEATRARR